MYDEYIKDKKITEKTEEEKEIELVVNILKVKQELEAATINFEYAQDDLIDYYTYQIKANRSKFNYLLKEAKKRNMALDMIKQFEIKYNKAI